MQRGSIANTISDIGYGASPHQEGLDESRPHLRGTVHKSDASRDVKTGEQIAGWRKRIKLLSGFYWRRPQCTCQMWSRSSLTEAVGSRWRKLRESRSSD